MDVNISLYENISSVQESDVNKKHGTSDLY